MNFDFAIVIDNVVYKNEDLVKVSSYDWSNSNNGDFDENSKGYVKEYIGRIVSVSTTAIKIDASEKYQSNIICIKLNDLKCIEKIG